MSSSSSRAGDCERPRLLFTHEHIFRAFVGSRRVTQTRISKVLEKSLSLSLSLSFSSLSSRSFLGARDSFLLFFCSLFLSLRVIDIVQPGVAVRRRGRSKARVRYANDEEDVDGATRMNTTSASEGEDEEDEDDEDEEDEDDEEESDSDEEDEDDENERAKKKQRIAATNDEKANKRKRTNWTEELFDLSEIAVEVLEKVKKKAKKLNFIEGSGAYVALVALLYGSKVGKKSMTFAEINKSVLQLGLEGKTKKGKKTKMTKNTIRLAMKRDDTGNFLQSGDGTYFLARELKERKDKMTKKEIESIESALKKIDKKVLAKVLADAKKKATNELNFKEGSGAYVALVALLSGSKVGKTSMTPTEIVEFARLLGLEGRTKKGKKTKMNKSTILSAMNQDDTGNFLPNRGGTFSLAVELKEKGKKTKTTTTKKKKKKNSVKTFHVQRENWKANEFPGIKIFNEEKDWCPLCNGRTVVRERSYSRLLSFSHTFLWNETKELLESTRGGIKVETEAFRDILLSYFQRNLHEGSCCVTGVTDFNSFQRKDGHICYHCLQNAKNHFSSLELD